MVLLRSDNNCIPLQSDLTTLLTPFMGGTHAIDGILKKLKSRARLAEVCYCLSSLEKAGVVVDSDDTEPLGMAAFRDCLNIEPNLFRRRLEETSVSVVSLGGIPIDPLLSVLESLHVRIAEAGTFRVVLTDNYLRKGLESYNRHSLIHSQPWMVAKPVGAILWIGPIFHPPWTGCWGCLAKRLNAHRLPYASLSNHRDSVEESPPLSKSLLPSTFHLGINILATEILKWIVQAENQSIEGKLVTFDVRSTTLEKHVLVAQQSCPDCGTSRRSSRTSCDRWMLAKPKVSSSDGGHRATSPEEVFRRYEHHISPITGIVRSLRAGYSAGGGLVHVFEADLNFAIRGVRPRCGSRGFRRKSFGKGITEIQAKASALCEALERYSGVFQGNETRMKATYRALSDQAIHPNQCMCFSPKQYQNRDQWNQCEAEYNWVPQPFDEEREIDWTPVWSLTEERHKSIPTAYCYFAYPYDPNHDFCRADSNGSAAGSTLEEAILQGFLEVVERDSVATWWYNRLRKPVVNLENLDLPYVEALRKHYAAYGREIHVLDITGDFGIPTFASLCSSTRADKRHLIFGFGAHFDAQTAVLQALTEMNQLLPGLLAANLPRLFVNDVQDVAFLEPDTTVARTCFANFPNLSGNDLREDVITCVKLARARGLELLVLNQTRPDVGLHVVKVLVPGMRQWWARFGSGRLYDVPVTMKWLKSALTEDELNPAHLVI